MDAPLETLKGVPLPVLMRIVLPGLLATAVLYPSVQWALGLLPAGSDSSWERIAAYAAIVGVSGALISTLNDALYQLYEGRKFWPGWLWDRLLNLQKARVAGLLKAAEAGLNAGETWYKLRIYPMDEKGTPEATFPTRMGNILAGYEKYPLDRYGMDSIFYWPRIWLLVEKEKKEEIDGRWSVADGLIALSAISFAGALAWMTEALVAALGGLVYSALPFGSPVRAAVASLGWIVLGYGWYRLSLPYHRANGEIFKALFDLYRDKIRGMTELQPLEKEKWRAAWAYLQYLQLTCPNCGMANTIGSEKCKRCGLGLAELNKSVRDSGRFPL